MKLTGDDQFELQQWLHCPRNTSLLKQLYAHQRVLLEGLDIIDTLCTRHNLSYFLCYGTLLGAIRHHGFIPWDDDADIVMPRRDYEQFLHIAEKELPPDWFIQSHRTERFYRHPFAKLRKNGTTCIIPQHRHIKMHQGIFVDIFVLDEWPTNRIKQWFFWHFTGWCERLCAFSVAHLPKKLRWLRIVQCMWCTIFTPSILSRCANFFAMVLHGRSGYYVNTFDTWRGVRPELFAKRNFEKATYIDFEGRQLRIPSGWHNILSSKYGDYMKLPKPESRLPAHASEGILDPNRDYREYL